MSAIAGKQRAAQGKTQSQARWEGLAEGISRGRL